MTADQGAAKAKRTTRQTTRKAARATGARQPWPGYDDLTVEEITDRLSRATDAKAREVRTYERAHKSRTGVVEAAQRELAATS